VKFGLIQNNISFYRVNRDVFNISKSNCNVYYYVPYIMLVYHNLEYMDIILSSQDIKILYTHSVIHGQNIYFM